MYSRRKKDISSFLTSTLLNDIHGSYIYLSESTVFYDMFYEYQHSFNYCILQRRACVLNYVFILDHYILHTLYDLITYWISRLLMQWFSCCDMAITLFVHHDEFRGEFLIKNHILLRITSSIHISHVHSTSSACGTYIQTWNPNKNISHYTYMRTILHHYTHSWLPI